MVKCGGVSPNWSKPHTHLAEWGGKEQWLMHSENLGETSRQVNRRLHSSSTATYLQVGNVQGVTQFSADSWDTFALKSSDSTEDRRRS